MPAHPFGYRRPRTIPWLVMLAVTGGLGAQSPLFAPPRCASSFNLGGTAANLDLNRDGSPDLIVPGLFFGTLATTLDERGQALATNIHGPTASSGVSPFALPIAFAAGRLDGDEFEDLISVTTAGTVHFHRNLGATSIDAVHFAPDQLVEDFRSGWPINPPMQRYVFAAAAVVDFDADGNGDLLLGGGPIDTWAGSTRPGFVALYRGDGQGGFQVHRHPVSGNVIDVQAADLDADGTLDHLVALVETGALGAFGYELVHLRWNGSQLVAGPIAAGIGSGRVTALAIADLIGDANLDYVLAEVQASGGTYQGSVICLAGNGLGQPLASSWTPLLLPANGTGLGDYIPAVCAEDFDGDGHQDLAVLRGYVTPVPATSSSLAPVADSDLLLATGPNALGNGAAVIPLPGSHAFASTHNGLFQQLPLVASPGLLRRIDLGGDQRVDLEVLALRTQQPNVVLQVALLKNLTPSAAGAPRCERIGEPSGGSPALPARLGFEGGPPRPGNGNFAATLQNVATGALAVLMWSPLGQADLFTSHGFTLHLAPAEFGFTHTTLGNPGGRGFTSYALPIPADPTLIGDAGWFQWFYYDPATAAFGGSHATGLSIGS